jgi:hypothetical protein
VKNEFLLKSKKGHLRNDLDLQTHKVSICKSSPEAPEKPPEEINPAEVSINTNYMNSSKNGDMG